MGSCTHGLVGADSRQLSPQHDGCEDAEKERFKEQEDEEDGGGGGRVRRAV